MEWVKIQVKSTATVEFEIFLHEKVNEEVDKNVIDLINFTDKIKSCYKDDNIKLMRVGFNNMSSGEMEYIDLFASIYANFSFEIIRDDDDDKYDFERYSKAINYLFILDEPDAAFHPEWSRKLIYYLTTFINKLLIGTNKKCQLIITTHSPFMVSDIPSEYVTCINLKVDEEGKYYRTIKKTTHSFAANIYELLNDGFFMDSPIGKFAQHKIQKIIDRINTLENLQDKDLMSEIEYISKMINIVSDKLVRGRLNDMFEKRKKILLDDKSTNVLEYLLIEIKELKREIVKLKSKENNGEKNDFN